MSFIRFICIILLYSNIIDVYSQFNMCYHGNNPQPCNIVCNNDSCNGNTNWHWKCHPNNDCNFECNNDCNNGGLIEGHSPTTIECNGDSCNDLEVSCDSGIYGAFCNIDCYGNSCTDIEIYCWPDTICTIECHTSTSCINADMKCHYSNCVTQGINANQVTVEEGWTHYYVPTPEPSNTYVFILFPRIFILCFYIYVYRCYYC